MQSKQKIAQLSSINAERMGIMLRKVLSKPKKLRVNSKQKSRNSVSTYRRLYSNSALGINNDMFDTPLHTLIRNCSSFHNLIDEINHLPREVVAQMARTTNNAGELPLDLLGKIGLLSDDQDLATGFLLDIISDNAKYKSLNEPISVSDTLNKYYPDMNNDLNENLTLACSVATKVRATVKYSTSHPDFNNLAIDEQFSITSILEDARSQWTATRYSVNSFAKPNKVAAVCDKYKVGNCEELSYMTIDILKDISKKPLYAYIVGYENGDHGFVVFGSHPIADPNQYHVKNTQATLCDGWAGVVGKFYRDDLMQMLGDYKAYYHPGFGNYFNVVTTFNPHYHRMTIQNSYNITGFLLHERTFFDCNSFGLFSGASKSDDNNIKKVEDAVSQKAEEAAKPSTP